MRLPLVAFTVTSLIPILTGCGTVMLPANVTMKSMGSYNVIGSVDFSYQATGTHNFSQLKLCIAENVDNNAVSLRDTVGSIALPGNYFQANNNQVIQGDGIFKFVDENSSTLIASGTEDGGPTALGLTRDFVKFDLKAAVNGDAITLIFSNIARAQQNTGSAANDGFQPVIVAPGAGSDRIYSALESTAGVIEACLQK